MNNKTIWWITSTNFFFFTIQLILQYPPDWLLSFIPATSEYKWKVNFNAFGMYGTTIAGVFSFTSIYLIYSSLKQQSNSFNLTQFENRVFELIRYHRDNVSIIKLRCPAKKTEVYYEGHKAIREIHKQVIDVIAILRDIFYNTLDNYDHNKSVSLITNKEIIERRIDRRKFDLYNVAYLCVFFGMSIEGQLALRKILKDSYSEKLATLVIDKLKDLEANWQRMGGDSNNCINNIIKPTKYYGGHQYRLGHYFRHLFQIVTYIDNNSNISFQQKYEYVTILRAQLSTYEQTLLFFNSISSIGRSWELDIKTDNIHTSKIQDFVKCRALITKYNMIRNIPDEFVADINISEIYPDITFQGEPNSPAKEALRLIYEKKHGSFSN